MSKFSMYLKKIRKKRGLTQKELAQKIGVSASQVCRFENDENTLQTITIFDVWKLSHVLNIRSTKLAKIVLRSM